MPSARPRARLAARVALLLGAGCVLSGCSSAVEVAVPDAAARCGTVRWPAAVHGEAARPTTPQSPAVHAWGDPAIVARCGVAALGPTTEECLGVDDVDWVARPLTDGTAFTTYGTDPAIEVLIPKVYGPEPLLLPAFSAAAKALPGNGRSCVG
jgi:hypothetical protein